MMLDAAYYYFQHTNMDSFAHDSSMSLNDFTTEVLFTELKAFNANWNWFIKI